jgi:hypothetical protein
MTTRGVLVLCLIGIALIVWVANQVRRDRLYVGYGVMFIVLTLCMMIVLSVPAVLSAVTYLVGAVYPASALALLAFGFIVFMLIYILTQVTLIANRLARLIQEIAIERTQHQPVLGTQVSVESTADPAGPISHFDTKPQ